MTDDFLDPFGSNDLLSVFSDEGFANFAKILAIDCLVLRPLRGSC